MGVLDLGVCLLNSVRVIATRLLNDSRDPGGVVKSIVVVVRVHADTGCREMRIVRAWTL